MTKSDMIATMERYTGACVITRTQLAKFLGYKDHRSVLRYLEGLGSIDGKLYMIKDVAENVMRFVR